MPSFLDRIRSGAGRAAFEADKQRRIVSVQLKIGELKRKARRGVSRIGNVAMDLYRAGRLTQPELQQLCEQVTELEAQIGAREQESGDIRREGYVERAQASPAGPSMQAGDVHSSELIVEPALASECQFVHEPSTKANAICSACKKALLPGAAFCEYCGHPVGE